MNPAPVIVLFDGECGFCQRMACWVAERDGTGRILLGSLQGEVAAVLGEKRSAEHRSVVLWEGSRRIEGAEAVWLILQRIGGFWSWVGLVGAIFPKAWANFAYRWVARHRHRWQKDSECKHLSLYHLAE
jgi:predicted DCC family thiol-disulfide oxidoreductase YuxK